MIKKNFRALTESKGALVSSVIIFSVVFLDQSLKIFIKNYFELGESYKITDWFIIHFLENNGFAFGYEFFGKPGKLLLTIFRLFASVFIFWWLRGLVLEYNKSCFGLGAICGLSLVFAVSLGNIIDSFFYGYIFNYSPLFYGKVVDMFYFPLFSGFGQIGSRFLVVITLSFFVLCLILLMPVLLLGRFFCCFFKISCHLNNLSFLLYFSVCFYICQS